MKKNISIKSWQSNFRERYPGLRRAVMIQRAMQAIRRNYWLKIAPERAVKFLPLKNPLVSIYQHFLLRRDCYAFGERCHNGVCNRQEVPK